MKRVPALLLLLCLPLAALAEIKTETIEYKDGDTLLKGYLAYDDDIDEKRPGVLVVHEWWGLTDYVRQRAEMLAELGYVAFAVDMYGDGKSTDKPDQAKAWMQEVSADTDAWRERASAGLKVLAGHAQVDPASLAAIGYCFGGATVLQLAYAGADLDGVASFHGALPPAPHDADIKGSVLALHGADDSMITMEKVVTFQESLTEAEADWQFVTYGGAQHGFTNPNVGEYGIEALAYDEDADRRSWELMQVFLTEAFGDEPD